MISRSVIKLVNLDNGYVGECYGDEWVPLHLLMYEMAVVLSLAMSAYLIYIQTEQKYILLE